MNINKILIGLGILITDIILVYSNVLKFIWDYVFLRDNIFMTIAVGLIVLILIFFMLAGFPYSIYLIIKEIGNAERINRVRGR